MDGFEVKKMKNAIPRANIVVTATGNKDVITEKHFKMMKDQAMSRKLDLKLKQQENRQMKPKGFFKMKKKRALKSPIGD
jgi:S-adenosylhomocysteine hydrolase